MTTATRERPILMRPELARKVVDGSKTQTRRIVKWNTPNAGLNLAFSGLSVGHYFTGIPSSGHVLYSRRADGVWEQRTKQTFCPYGSVGDRLWVRETFLPCRNFGDQPLAIGLASYVCFRDGSQKFYGDGSYHHEPARSTFNWPSGAVWRPSIHMPRWASRATLEITEVRIERLQAITETDARAEGVDWAAPEPYGETWDDDREDPREVGYAPAGSSFARDNFGRLWDQLNGKRPGCSWADNPWVWAITFRRVEQPS